MSCTSALNNFAACDLTNWTGLPESCSLAEVMQQFRLLDEDVGLTRLGDIKREFRMFAVSGYDEPVRVWTEDSRVMTLDVEHPSFSMETRVLLLQLGEPEAKLDYDWGTMRFEKSEWVYPDRGLALFLAPDASSVFHLAAFPPTTMQAYKENFQLHLGKRLFPMG